MPYCTRCGKPIEEGQVCDCVKKAGRPSLDTSSLRGFIGSLKNHMGIGDESLNQSDWYERGKAIVPECVAPNEGEIPIKQYDITILRTWYKFMRAEGRMQLTNKRLIFRATGRSIMGRTAQQHEFALDEIAGLEIRRDYRISFLNIFLALIVMGLAYSIFGSFLLWVLSKVVFLAVILGILIGIAGIIPFFMLHKKFWLKLFCNAASVVSFSQLMLYLKMTDHGFWGGVFTFLLIIAGILTLANFFLVIFMPNLVMEVKTKGATPAIQIRRQVWSLFKGPQSEFTGYSEVRPWKDTGKAMQELWPMINDIQTLGDYGIRKWQEGQGEAVAEEPPSVFDQGQQESVWN